MLLTVIALPLDGDKRTIPSLSRPRSAGPAPGAGGPTASPRRGRPHTRTPEAPLLCLRGSWPLRARHRRVHLFALAAAVLEPDLNPRHSSM